MKVYNEDHIVTFTRPGRGDDVVVQCVLHAVPLPGGGEEGEGGHLCSISGHSTGLYYSYGGPDIR